MLLIRNIKIKEVPGDYVEVYEKKFNKREFNTDDGFPTKEQTEIYCELVDGVSFINERDQEICIGATKKIQETLGLCFKSFENQNNTIYTQHNKLRVKNTIINKLEQRIINFNNKSFFKRLRFLFKGERI